MRYKKVVILGTVLITLFVAMCLGEVDELLSDSGEKCSEELSGITYTIYYSNGTYSVVTSDSESYAALNNSTMKFLTYIAYASERIIEPEDLDAELKGTDHLELASNETIVIETIEGLDPDWPQGYTIETKRIVIKLGEAEAEERIYTFHEEEWPPIKAWRSVASVDMIIQDLM